MYLKNWDEIDLYHSDSVNNFDPGYVFKSQVVYRVINVLNICIKFIQYIILPIRLL